MTCHFFHIPDPKTFQSISKKKYNYKHSFVSQQFLRPYHKSTNFVVHVQNLHWSFLSAEKIADWLQWLLWLNVQLAMKRFVSTKCHRLKSLMNCHLQCGTNRYNIWVSSKHLAIKGESSAIYM